MKLVIVESPAKAKTISKILGKEFVVESSIGHIRDLPKNASDVPAKYKGEKWARLGVNVEADFEPLYVVSGDKKKQVKKLKDLLKKADELYLATDEDREGESISWHLLEVLSPKKGTKVKRLAFHEITKEAILKALANPREVDMNLVSAQETRRILDRLYGYEVSPILWRKVAPKLSAGRVQSVALRLIVERERARMAFKEASYCSIKGIFEEGFEAVLKSFDDQRVAVGKDFDANTGLLSAKKLLHLKLENLKEVLKDLKEMDYKITEVENKSMKSSPYAPFITSTLQQEANYKLGLSSRETMQVAQKLYENGYITYMRTDSISLSAEAIEGCRKIILAEYGSEYLPNKARVFKSKVKNAQEAHEAIRPAGVTFKSPASLKSKLSEIEYRLYSLIYKRTLASQMADAVLQQTVVTVESLCQRAVFQANGKMVEFDGYMRIYGNPEEKDVLLPVLKKGQVVNLKELESKEHKTQPPARYNEASLVKELESRGIGRPSTYASIIDTILRRNYVYKVGKALVPTFVAFAVIKMLESYFDNLVDYQFTANMEEDLDAISRGEEVSLDYLKKFYVELVELVKTEIDARSVCTIPLEEGDGGACIRIGKYGPFIEKGELRASVPADLEPDKLNLEKALELLANSKEVDQEGVLGVSEDGSLPVYKKIGRFGPYVQLGDGDLEKKIKAKMKSIPKEVAFDDVGIEEALRLLSMPLELGVYEKNEEKILLDVGRFGPYVKAGSETRSVDGAKVLTLTLAEAVELLNTEKPTRGRRQAKMLKDFTGEGNDKVKILDGKYGPYVTNGKKNKSVPKGMSIDEVTLDKALEMLL